MNARQRIARKRLIWERYRRTCQGCGVKLSLEEATLDHIIPKSKGGANRLENLQIMCFACNQAKDNVMPDDGRGALKESGSARTFKARMTPPPGFAFTGGVFAEWKEKLGL